jgi:PAS domain S-box-containing protein
MFLYRILRPFSSSRATSLSLSRVRSLIWVFAVILLGMVIAILAVTLATTYDTNLDLAAHEVEAKNALFRQSTELVVGDLDSLLLSLSERVLNRQAGAEPLQASLVRIAATVPSIRVLLVIDAQGMVIADSRAGSNSVGIDVSDRRYYQAHLEDRDSGLFIDRPVQSRFDGSWSLPMSRAIRGDDGSLRGVVIASISPRYFDQVLASVAQYPSEKGLLVLRDGAVVLASFPYDEALLGTSIAGSPLWPAEPREGLVTPLLRLDGRDMIASSEPVEPWPLVVNYRLDRADALALFRRDALLATAISGALVLSILAFAYYQTRQLRVLASYTQTLEQLNGQLKAEIAQRSETERSLRLYKQTVESSGDMVLVIDRAYRYRIVNATFLHYLQIERERILGAAADDVREDLAGFAQLMPEIERCLAGETVRLELKSRFPLLGERDLSVGIFPIADGASGVAGAIIIARDITDWIALERRYQQAQKLETIGRLAGGIAHDFNNLLVPILGYAELALMDVPPESPLYASLNEIRSAGEKGAGLTRQILAFSRRQVLQIQTIDLNETIEGLKRLIARVIGEDIMLETILAPGRLLINADQGQIEQVLMNIVVNAREAMPTGGRLLIETDIAMLDGPEPPGGALAHEPGQYVLLAVSDTGLGMDERIREQAFEPFFTTKEHGTGLGLATVHGIVRQHGGLISLYSELGKGTTFKIYLPHVEQALAAGSADPAAAPPLDGVETVLLVEDELMVRQLIRDALHSCGYTILEAETPGEALRLAAEHPGPIDLLLTDVIMPGMNGRQLQEALQGVRPGLRTLFISGYTDNIIAQHGVLPDCTRFLQKPFAIRSLLLKVRAALAGAVSAP